jgi:putative RecB family exonuclease
MPLEPPRTLSPSKVAAFTDCALAFRFATIERLPEPPSPSATKGTLVHAALERLFLLPPADRTVAAALTCLDAAFTVLRTDAEFLGLHLGPDDEAAFLDDAERLVRQYFALEDPTTIRPIGIEVMLDAEVGGVRVRGIIDRLELDQNGELVVVDYKTGRAPSERYENGRLDGVQFYSLLCERNFGRRPSRVKLLYLADPLEISTVPSERSSRAIERKVGAIWSAVERACARDDFRPKPSKLCEYCAFRVYCPAFGGEVAEGVRVAATMHSAATLERLAPASASVALTG